ncbi:MAG TPA: rhodanese-like domain-containing protein [Thiobacillus sp.]
MLLRLFGVVLLVVGFGGCAEPPYTLVDHAQLKTLMAEGVPLYDIRRPDEWRATGVVEGSHTLTYVDASGRLNPEFVPRFTAEVGKNDPVVLICRTGNRTDKLARALLEMGYTQVYSMRNGVPHWISEGHPIVKN